MIDFKKKKWKGILGFSLCHSSNFESKYILKKKKLTHNKGEILLQKIFFEIIIEDKSYTIEISSQYESKGEKMSNCRWC